MIALDELGFGESEKPRIHFDADVLARSALRFLDALGIRPAAVVGASLGGHVAARMAAIDPNRVSRLVLMDSSGYGDPGDPPPPAMPADPHTLDEQKTILRILLYDQKRVTEALVKQRLAAHLKSGDAYTRAHFQSPAEPLPPLLYAITAPTLLIWGKHDRLVPLVAACRFRRNIREATMVVIDAAAHVPQMEQPAAFNSTLVEFLKGHQITDESVQYCNSTR